MELLDLYTEDRVRTGKTMVRGTVVPEGLCRLVVHVCIFDSQGRMLIQQRQPFKSGWSNYWDMSVGGCAVAGDTSIAAAERETREEIGLSVDLTGVRPVLTINFERGFDDFYTVETDGLDLSSLKLQDSEVAEVRWASLGEVRQMLQDGTFVPYFPGLIEMLWQVRDNYDGAIRQKRSVSE